jgi:osmotically-inducible protein OsmY
MDDQHSTGQHDEHAAPAAEPIDDIDLAAEIHHRLMTYTPLREVATLINVTVEHGHARLTGHVRGTLHKHAAVSFAQSVPGVIGVDDHELYADNELEIAAATRLAQVGATHAALIRVRAMAGTLVLTAHDVDPATLDAALALVRGVPGVRGVTLGLREKLPAV